MTIGVPIKLLHEAQGHIISLELKTGQLYRGKLLEGTRLLQKRDDYLFDTKSRIKLPQADSCIDELIIRVFPL